MHQPELYGLAGFDRTLTPAELSHDMLAFEAELAALRFKPPGKSEALRAFSTSATQNLNDDSFPEFRDTVEEFIRDRPDMEAPYKVQVFWRAFQYILLGHNEDKQYPQAYKSTSAWDAAFRTILVDEPGSLKADSWKLKEILAVSNNQTNEPRRYAGVKLAIAAHADSLPDSPSMVDAGCSAGLGQIQIGENIPFRGIRIKNSDPAIRRTLRQAFMAKVALSNNIGFDRVVGIDPRWVEACSYYPSELEESPANHSKQKFREQLYRERGNFIRLHGDLTDGPASMAEIIARNHGRPYDIATALTALYEVPKVNLPVAMASLDALSENLIVVQDFAEIDPSDPTQLIFTDDIYHPTAGYNLLTKQRSLGDERWTQLGTWSTGRCAIFNPTEALVDRIMGLK